jgi:hypothetical protein
MLRQAGASCRPVSVPAASGASLLPDQKDALQIALKLVIATQTDQSTVTKAETAQAR